MAVLPAGSKEADKADEYICLTCSSIFPHLVVYFKHLSDLAKTQKNGF